MGGDEFVAGLTGMGLEAASRRFTTIDRELRGDVGVGITVGLAQLEPDETLERLTGRADAALLDARAKRSQ